MYDLNISFISPTAPYEILDTINLLKVGKLTGPNNIPIELLKVLSVCISSPLSDIINQSFQTGNFPVKIQQARVIPLCKKGCPLSASNYRLKSLLSYSVKLQRN